MTIRPLAPLLSLLVAGSAWATPHVGDRFAYRYERTIEGTGGAYVGYRDQLRSDGRYEVTAATDATMDVHARYEWSWASTEGKRESGLEDRQVTVRLDDRRYQGSRTDLDEFDAVAAGDLATWFWIPTNLGIGDRVRILDEEFTVEGVDQPAPDGGPPAIVVSATGTKVRDDEYGTFTATWQDIYWFDVNTGWFLAEQYTEQDEGTFEGQAASMKVDERVGVVAWELPAEPVEAVAPPAYADGADPSAAEPEDLFLSCLGSVCMPAFTMAPVLGFLAAVHWLTQRSAVPKSVETPTFGTVTVSPIKSADELVGLEPAFSNLFPEFGEDFARRTILAGGFARKAVAGHKLVGLALWDGASAIGSVYAGDDRVADLLRRHLPAGPCFAEKPFGQRLELYRVLAVSPVPELDYDPDRVQRLKPEDVDAAGLLCEAAFGVPCKDWVRAQVAAGDVGFVAREGGQLVGVGLLSVVGEIARLHTVAVATASRGRGIGTELVRARLRAAADLGATRAIAEVADGNVASLHLLERAGFVQLGELGVYTADTVLDKAPGIIRR